MKKFLCHFRLFISFHIKWLWWYICEKKGLSGDSPPNVSIEIDGETMRNYIGLYYWDISKGKSECVDTTG